MLRLRLLVLSACVSASGCGDKSDETKQKPPAPAESTSVQAANDTASAANREPAAATATPSCKEQAAELRAFLTEVFDENSRVEAPWPTGDPELDAQIEQARAKARELMNPADLSEKAIPLAPGIDDSADKAMYRDCPEGLAALRAVTTAPADKRVEAFIKIADGVEACGCKVNIPWLKAAYYLLQRGP
jgi:hypothetical protein